MGAECAVCEEPLEHTLRGERILQFSCSHVSHEACFYEFIREFESQYCPTCNAPLHLDTSRGGNVLDIGTSPSSCEVFVGEPLTVRDRENQQHGPIRLRQRHKVDEHTYTSSGPGPGARAGTSPSIRRLE